MTSNPPSCTDEPACSGDNIIGLVVFGIYEITEVLGTGAFSKVYAGKDLRDNSMSAVKIERRNVGSELLPHEYNIYQALHHPTSLKGILKVYHYDSGIDHNVLVMDIAGPRLRAPGATNPPLLSINATLCAGIDLLQIISAVHSRGIVHLDIKPGNILQSRNSLSSHPQVQLVDFGLAERYINARTGRHRLDEEDISPGCTLNFASLRAHARRTRSRADDLESLGYVLIFVCMGHLPWHAYSSRNRAPISSHGQRLDPDPQRANMAFENVGRMKSTISIRYLCDGMPPEIQFYFEYVYALGFYQRPDYDFLLLLLRSALSTAGGCLDG